MHLVVPQQLPSEYSPTGGAIAPGVAIIQPDSRGAVTLPRRDPRGQAQIAGNLLSSPGCRPDRGRREGDPRSIAGRPSPRSRGSRSSPVAQSDTTI